jgi:hypothetical protein
MDNASIQHHGTSCQAGDINTVIVRDKMIAGGSVDMVRDHLRWWSRAVTSGHQPLPMPLSQHGRYPAYTLLDNVMGGVFKGNGGDNVAMPHHPKGTPDSTSPGWLSLRTRTEAFLSISGLTIWNFEYHDVEPNSGHYCDFWPDALWREGDKYGKCLSRVLLGAWLGTVYSPLIHCGLLQTNRTSTSSPRSAGCMGTTL